MAGLLARMFGAEATPEWTEPEALRARLAPVRQEGEDPPLVVDVRGPDEFDGPLGHIKSATNIPLDGLSEAIADLAARHRPIVLVCHTDRRSAAAAAQLRKAGVQDVSVLRGGMVAWRELSSKE
jgi:rhodanese-related sulfurtransferase